jgi:hypothetical protein
LKTREYFYEKLFQKINASCDLNTGTLNTGGIDIRPFAGPNWVRMSHKRGQRAPQCRRNLTDFSESKFVIGDFFGRDVFSYEHSIKTSIN